MRTGTVAIFNNGSWNGRRREGLGVGVGVVVADGGGCEGYQANDWEEEEQQPRERWKKI